MHMFINFITSQLSTFDMHTYFDGRRILRNKLIEMLKKYLRFLVSNFIYLKALNTMLLKEGKTSSY